MLPGLPSQGQLLPLGFQALPNACLFCRGQLLHLKLDMVQDIGHSLLVVAAARIMVTQDCQIAGIGLHGLPEFLRDLGEGTLAFDQECDEVFFVEDALPEAQVGVVEYFRAALFRLELLLEARPLPKVPSKLIYSSRAEGCHSQKDTHAHRQAGQVECLEHSCFSQAGTEG